MRDFRNRTAALVSLLAMSLAPATLEGQRTCPNGATAVGDYGLEAVDARILWAEVHPDDATRTRVRFGSELMVRTLRAGSAGDGILRPDDVIVALDGALVTTFEGSRLISHPPIDRPVRITVRRRGQEEVVTVTPRESCMTLFGPALVPRNQQQQQIPPGEYVRVGHGDGWLGIRFECPACAGDDDHFRAQVLLTSRPRVVEVARGGPADRAGVRAGDVLTRVNGSPVPGAAAHLAMGSLRPGTRVKLGLLRDGREIEIETVAGQAPQR